jgi:hypothetical protein
MGRFLLSILLRLSKIEVLRKFSIRNRVAFSNSIQNRFIHEKVLLCIASVLLAAVIRE